MTKISLRPARKSDAADLAILDNLASHGMSAWFWQKEFGPLEVALCLGRSRFAMSDAVYGWSNSLVAVDEDDCILGVACGYEMPETDKEVEYIKKEAKPFAPVFELFEQTVGNWLIDTLAVYPEFQRKGIASRLLDASLAQAREAQMTYASLVVEDSNAAANALYVSRNFKIRETRPYVEFNGPSETKYWQLMTAQI